MSQGINYLHSHSALERMLKETAKDKFLVLVDAKYKDLFPEDAIKQFPYHGKMYYRVPTLMFVKRGGVFKNLSE